MKNLDPFSRKLLSIAVSISMVLLSGSLFITTLNNSGKVNASPLTGNNPEISKSVYTLKNQVVDSTQTENLDESIFAIQAFGMGIREGQVYFGILYNNNTIGLHKAKADGEDVLLW